MKAIIQEADYILSEMIDAWNESTTMDRILVSLIFFFFGAACFAGGFIAQIVY